MPGVKELRQISKLAYFNYQNTLHGERVYLEQQTKSPMFGFEKPPPTTLADMHACIGKLDASHFPWRSYARSVPVVSCACDAVLCCAAVPVLCCCIVA